jgi:hypothetical protein
VLRLTLRNSTVVGFFDFDSMLGGKVRRLERVSRVVHCDWGANPRKRVLCKAERADGGWLVSEIDSVGSTDDLLTRLTNGLADHTCSLIGFDFPIGYPMAYGVACPLDGFVESLASFGDGEWSSFFTKARTVAELSLVRPFYPHSCPTKGFATRQKLTDSLGIEWKDLFRECELKTDYRPEASPLFWTLGAKAVGTAALLGWKEVLQPLLNASQREIGLWPFEGSLESLVAKRTGVLVETYPGEAYSHLGFPKNWSGKTSHRARKERAGDLFKWAKNAGASFSDKVHEMIASGFGERKDGEDPFDALVGACSMIEVVEGRRSAGAPSCELKQKHEGWIFGQKSAIPVAGN